uniref:hypothetical protein n=1 Tax=Endozoicomonas acroporae TaxID=1701104 RepID=UPI001C611140
RPDMDRFLSCFRLFAGWCLPALVDVNGDAVSAVTEEEGDCMLSSGITCFQLENRLGMTTIERKR